MTIQRPTPMPTLFVPHGAGPCFFMEWSPADAWTAMADFLRGIAATLPRTPEAIVNRLSAEFNKVAKDPALIKRIGQALQS